MTSPSWSLKIIRLSNILGFFGQKELKFAPGLQVIEAHNHTGKTSLAIALLWGLTGKVPSLGRIKNKLAADKDLAKVEIILENNNGQQLEIRRSTNGTGIKSQLTALKNDKVYTDAEAQEIISSEIGLKAQSLEGCSVVLKDQRLNLIAGDLAESSKIIHDILGLSTLSKLVPIIKTKLSVLNKLIKDFEEKDLLKKWEERNAELNQELNAKEIEAIKKGNDPQILQSNFLENEFSFLCKKLDYQNNFPEQTPNDLVSTLKKTLSHQRNQNPYKPHEDELVKKIFLAENALKKIREISADIKEIEIKYTESSNHHQLKMSQIIPALQEFGFKIAAKQSILETLKEQNGLFSHSLSLLKKPECDNSCPLCETPINRHDLLKNIESKLGDIIKESISKQESDSKQLIEEKNNIEKLKLDFISFENRLKTLLQDTFNALNPLEKCQTQIEELKQKTPLLDQTSNLSTFFESIDASLQKDLTHIHTEHEKIKMMCQDYTEEFKPWEDRLDNLIMYLIPIYDIHKKIVDHGNTRNEQLNKSQAHSTLLNQTKSYAKQFEELILFLQTQEKNKANQIILEHQDFVSDFFVKVADNPHYDKIAITTKEDRGSIKYDFQASSTNLPNLADSAKHVLSGGDLSIACLGLMLSLTKGKSNKTGFIVLDDPAESLDALRIKNFAKEIQALAGHQTIILTHQADFAENLRQHGASSMFL